MDATSFHATGVIHGVFCRASTKQLLQFLAHSSLPMYGVQLLAIVAGESRRSKRRLGRAHFCPAVRVSSALRIVQCDPLHGAASAPGASKTSGR